MVQSLDTRSQEYLGNLENRLEMLQTTMHNQLDQSSQDINDLKQIAIRLEEGMKSMEAQFVSFTLVAGKQPVVGNEGNSGPEGSSNLTITSSSLSLLEAVTSKRHWGFGIRATDLAVAVDEFERVDDGRGKGWAMG